MGVGEFLSSKANNEWILSEKKREEWEMENFPEGEIQVNRCILLLILYFILREKKFQISSYESLTLLEQISYDSNRK